MILLFDFDGTLGDTNSLIMDSFRFVFEKNNISYTDQDLLNAMGPTLSYTFSQYTDDEKRVIELINDYRSFNIKNHDSYIKPFPKVKETLKKLYEKGHILGIITSKKNDLAMHGAECIGIDKYISILVGNDDVIKPKPDKEIVMKALEMLHTNERPIVIGDNPSDILAGKNAGSLTCGVNWSLKKEELIKLNPDYMIDDMTDLLKIVGENNA